MAVDPMTVQLLAQAGDKANSSIAGLVQLGYGAYQTIRAGKELKGLRGTPMARYDITPEQTRSYNRAEENALTGLSGAERNTYVQDIAGAQNMAYRRAQQIGGGNGARSIVGALGAQRLNAFNDLAALNARLKRQNMAYADNVGQGLTMQRNRQTAQDIAYRMELERNLGLAKQQGQLNMVNAVTGYLYANNNSQTLQPTQQGFPGFNNQPASMGGNPANPSSPYSDSTNAVYATPPPRWDAPYDPYKVRQPPIIE